MRMISRVLGTAAVAGIALLGPAPAVFAQPTDKYDCSDFTYQEEAQAVLDQDRSDPYGLDDDNDGKACETLPSKGGQPSTPSTPSTPSSTVTQAPPVVTSTKAAPADLDCADFATQAQAQAVLDADRSDPHRLDADHDGIACETRFGEKNTTGGGSQVKVKPVGGVDTGGGDEGTDAGAAVAVGALVLVGGGAGTMLLLRRRAGR
ncbi:excalibur calcium-binding domain-containing protein [Amycolatopsis ruanii]|uniref:excalibur calcium-binding domain-containing protein n=1 Tax=Amycolatopsis ruanii TaxID=944491 RepID=UPI000E23ED00|nr:excalibur calcium-binding domain-containing protein [Amycolatopsis ruanii]